MIAFVNTFVLPAAFALLPPEMDTPEARAMLIAIGLQESKFTDRYQVLESGRRGDGRGFYQFEIGGVAGVLAHRSTRPIALKVLDALRYGPDSRAALAAIEHHDVLATIFARLLLWTDPDPLPGPNAQVKAWKYYQRLWRPGRPHPDAWPDHFAKAWHVVAGE